jgi:hypothetical protein
LHTTIDACGWNSVPCIQRLHLQHGRTFNYLSPAQKNTRSTAQLYSVVLNYSDIQTFGHSCVM